MDLLQIRAPALLSFSLPGLGQLSQQRYPWAVGFFAAFVFSIAVLGAWWTIPFLALLAGLETMRSPRTGGFTDRPRQMAYGIVGALGLICWFGYTSSYLLPGALQAQLNDQVDTVRAAFRRCRAFHAADGNAVLKCLKADSASGAVDPWGRPYDFVYSQGVFEMRSGGPDKSMGTGDDLVYSLFQREEGHSE
jgi:hypothetical protein